MIERREDVKLAFFGIHPCDANAIRVMDLLLLEGPADPYYRHRRDNCLIAVLDCVRGDKYCFCEGLGARLPWKGSCDLWIVPQRSYFAIAPTSDKGRSVLERLSLERTDPPRLAHGISRNEPLERLVDILKDSYEAVQWKGLSSRCLLCGGCTAVCPTCICFDILDEISSNPFEGDRIRVWDSCIFRSFTVVAGGHVMRKEPVDRFKHRFYHKLVFIKERYGVYGCTGCGRCAQQCPSHIDPLEVVREVVCA